MSDWQKWLKKNRYEIYYKEKGLKWNKWIWAEAFAKENFEKAGFVVLSGRELAEKYVPKTELKKSDLHIILTKEEYKDYIKRDSKELAELLAEFHWWFVYPIDKDKTGFITKENKRFVKERAKDFLELKKKHGVD